jgi:membrane protease YdiL (CAAX protease family)
MMERPDFARPLGPMAAAGWSALFLLLFVLLGSVLAGIRPGSEHDGVTAALLYTVAALLTLLFIARTHTPEAELRDLLGARPLGIVSAFLAAVMGACASFPLGALEDLITKRFVTAEQAAEYTKTLASVGRNERVAGVAALLLVAPIADELLFRGALVTGITRDRGKIVAATTTAITFALVSSANDLHYLPLYFAMGLILAHARLATGSVLAAVGAHLGYRAAELATTLRAHGTIDPLVTGLTGAKMQPRVLVAAALGVMFTAWLLARVGEGEPLTEPVPPSGEKTE